MHRRLLLGEWVSYYLNYAFLPLFLLRPSVSRPFAFLDYIKVDGCGDNSYYPAGYQAMGAALEATGREIVYSCSWPAYIGDNETQKPFGTFIMDGCNLWRNWCVPLYSIDLVT